jgi:hypothetical protein
MRSSTVTPVLQLPGPADRNADASNFPAGSLKE